jgi:hypothetical protein
MLAKAGRSPGATTADLRIGAGSPPCPIARRELSKSTTPGRCHRSPSRTKHAEKDGIRRCN